MEESLLKSNFIGRDGFLWWIGQIPPIDAWEGQGTGKGWGNRYKVRIMGYHPYSTEELPDEDLPWAGVVMPPGTGTGAGNVASTIKFSPGDTVIGFFLDGDNAQLPMIMGAFGNSVYSAKDGEKIPFGSFTGRTKYMPKPSTAVLRATETNDANAASQKSPQHLSPADAKKYADNASYADSAGSLIPLPCGESGSQKTIDKIKIAIQGFIKFIKDLKIKFDSGLDGIQDWINEEIDIRAYQIQKIASKMVSGITNRLYDKLIKPLQEGLELLFQDVFGKTMVATGGNYPLSYSAGVLAQELMIEPIKTLQDLIPCLVNEVIKKLIDPIKEILKTVANKVLNFVECVADQVVGGIFNVIADGILGGIESALNGVSAILQFIENFNAEDIIRNGIEAIAGLIGIQSCNKESQQEKYGACKYKIGSGPVFQSEPDLQKIVKNANAAKAISAAAALTGVPLEGIENIVGAFDILTDKTLIPNATSAVEACYSGIPLVCNPPILNIFGGGGSGAKAIPLFGSIVGTGTNKTGSIIGYKVTDPGSGYLFPPFVEIVDNCNQGYGAQAKAVIKDGKVDFIYGTSDGENYPVGEELPTVLTDTKIIDTGFQYSNQDKVTDDLGNEYKIKVVDGNIVKVDPINKLQVSKLPVITVESETGSGAVIVPILDILEPQDPTTFTGDVENVIDCIT